MTKALDAALRAAQEQYDDGEYAHVIARAALHAALPAEVPEWFLVWYGNYGARQDGVGYAWRALRAQIFGEEK